MDGSKANYQLHYLSTLSHHQNGKYWHRLQVFNVNKTFENIFNAHKMIINIRNNYLRDFVGDDYSIGALLVLNLSIHCLKLCNSVWVRLKLVHIFIYLFIIIHSAFSSSHFSTVYPHLTSCLVAECRFI